MSEIEFKIGKKAKLPQFDLPMDFIASDEINADLLKFYTEFPCKIDACIFAYIRKGNIKAQINLWEHEITANNLVIVIPGTFIQIQEVSSDTMISFVGFSFSYIKSINFWKSISPLMPTLFNKPILVLPPEVGSIYEDGMSLLTRSSALGNKMTTPNTTKSVMNLLIDSLVSQYNQAQDTHHKSRSSRDHEILSEFLQLAFENYHDEHKIAFYAREANLTLSHFCNVITKATGMSPQVIIMHMIIMDAKTQLKGTSNTINKIATSLGFTAPTTFNRYFKTYTSMTPQEYRNSSKQ